MEDKNLAVTKAGEMFYGTILRDIPKECIEYLTYLSSRVGICGEVYLTAFAYYNQAVLGMPCEDDLYKIPQEEKDWFIKKGYYEK